MNNINRRADDTYLLFIITFHHVTEGHSMDMKCEMYDGSICCSKSKLFAVSYTLKHLVYSTFFFFKSTSLKYLVVRLLMNEFKIGVLRKSCTSRLTSCSNTRNGYGIWPTTGRRYALIFSRQAEACGTKCSSPSTFLMQIRHCTDHLLIIFSRLTSFCPNKYHTGWVSR